MKQSRCSGSGRPEVAISHLLRTGVATRLKIQMKTVCICMRIIGMMLIAIMGYSGSFVNFIEKSLLD